MCYALFHFQPTWSLQPCLRLQCTLHVRKLWAYKTGLLQVYADFDFIRMMGTSPHRKFFCEHISCKTPSTTLWIQLLAWPAEHIISFMLHHFVEHTFVSTLSTDSTGY